VDDDIWTCSHTLKGHVDCVTHVAFTGSKEHLMLGSVSRDGIIRLWRPDKDPFGDNSVWT
jgi:WD40 repeat protein